MASIVHLNKSSLSLLGYQYSEAYNEDNKLDNKTEHQTDCVSISLLFDLVGFSCQPQINVCLKVCANIKHASKKAQKEDTKTACYKAAPIATCGYKAHFLLSLDF